jgi:DNA ligase (NAD+)
MCTKYKINPNNVYFARDLQSMYTKAQIHNLLEITKDFLSNPSHINIEPLKQVLRFHEYQYYVAAEPFITDFEYDTLYQELLSLEAANPSSITPDSPSQRVGSSINQNFETVPHLVPMLSLDNSYNADDLNDFDRKVQEGASGEDVKYCVEPKFDGASISLIYENDLLTRACTRGDGVAGEDITNNIKQIKSIPLSIPMSNYGIQQMEIRGEVIMTKKSFDAFNQKLIDKNMATLANPRNAAAGSLRMKDPKEVAERNLDAFIYHVSYFTLLPSYSTPVELQSHAASLELLWQLGFRSPKNEKRVMSSIASVIDFCNEFEAHRDNLAYEIDGLVIKVDNLHTQEVLGMTSHHPRWAIAYKFKARQATTILENVEFQVGRTGAVTPVAKLKPVPIGGVTVSSISIHNEDYIKEKDLKLGDHVIIERAGDVIPQIVHSITSLRKGTEKEIIFPTTCPVCSSELEKEETEAVWRCNNPNCDAQVVERIIHFVSKDAMDIKNLGDANIRKFFELGLLKTIPGIYQLDFSTIGSMEGFGKKSIENLQKAIEASKTQPLYRLLYALGIRYVGETTAKTIANQIKHILDLAQFTEEQLQSFEDVGVKVANSIYHYFHDPKNIALIEALGDCGVTLEQAIIVKASGSFDGLNFLFTGTLSQLKRSDAEAMVESKGGHIMSGVSSKLHYLVVGEDAGSKLEKAKKIASIKIITEAEFIELIKN